MQVTPRQYLGIDISSLMISRASAAYPKFEFAQCNFLTSERFHEDSESKFDCVLFNGSLQFFQDVEHALLRSKGCLADGGRIIIAHANGAAFVKEEKRQNPNVVQAELPTEETLKALASSLGMSGLPMTTSSQDAEASADEFYLAGFAL